MGIQTIALQVLDQGIRILSAPPLVAGTTGVYTVEFSFNALWEGWTKVAVFSNGTSSKEYTLTEDACTVPGALLLPGRALRIGIYGVQEDSLLPTLWTCPMGIAPGACPSGETAVQTALSGANAGAHNAIYRGDYLGDALTAAQASAIAAGTFEGMYIGDYWTIDGIQYRIAAFDYYYMEGDTACKKHHVTLVPDTTLYMHVMNDTAITTGAYVGSQMYTEGLEDAKTIIQAAFGADHLLTHRAVLQNAAADGIATGGAWYDSAVELMNEQNVYGSKNQSAIGNGTVIPNNYTLDRSQYPLFLFRPDIVSMQRVPYWLRDVVSEKSFAVVGGEGNITRSFSTAEYGVRPAFNICG